jgi:hypothetical protein
MDIISTAYQKISINRRYARLKRKVHLLLDPVDGGTFWDKVVNSIIVTLILLNLLAVILEAMDGLYRDYAIWFRNFESMLGRIPAAVMVMYLYEKLPASLERQAALPCFPRVSGRPGGGPAFLPAAIIGS